MILLVLGISDPKFRDVRNVALKQVGQIGRAGVVKLAAGLAKLPPAAQAALLDVLGGRRCPAALPAVLEAVKSPNEKVALAALRALGGVGDASVVPLLLEKTFAGGQPAAAARESLETIFAKGTDEILLERMKTATDAGQRKTLIEILDKRMVASAVPVLLVLMANQDADVRRAAITALTHLATPNDVTAMIGAMFQSKDGGDREENPAGGDHDLRPLRHVRRVAPSRCWPSTTPPARRRRPCCCRSWAGSAGRRSTR